MRTRTSPLTVAALLTATVGLVAACGSSSGHTTPSATGTQAAQGVAVKVSDSSLGPILTDQDGRTLYAFTLDKGGSSTCTGTCIATWPALVSKSPVQADSGAQATLISQTKRSEGVTQATYNQWPLYYYVGDVAPGDVDGQGSGGVWFVVGSDGKLIKNNA